MRQQAWQGNGRAKGAIHARHDQIGSVVEHAQSDSDLFCGLVSRPYSSEACSTARHAFKASIYKSTESLTILACPMCTTCLGGVVVSFGGITMVVIEQGFPKCLLCPSLLSSLLPCAQQAPHLHALCHDSLAPFCPM